MAEGVRSQQQAHQSLQKLLDDQISNISVKRKQEAFELWARTIKADSLVEVEQEVRRQYPNICRTLREMWLSDSTRSTEITFKRWREVVVFEKRRRRNPFIPENEEQHANAKYYMQELGKIVSSSLEDAERLYSQIISVAMQITDAEVRCGVLAYQMSVSPLCHLSSQWNALMSLRESHLMQ